MRCNIWFAVMAGLVAGAAAVAPARADGTEPVIVIPGRPGVPVMMYGRDISWAVVEGDWGLARPGIVAPVVLRAAGTLLPAHRPSAALRPARGHPAAEPPAAAAGRTLLSGMGSPVGHRAGIDSRAVRSAASHRRAALPARAHPVPSGIA